MAKILFAMTHVLTSQGWFQPTQLLPQLDLPEEEVDKLVEEGTAARAEHDSPLAARVHELAKEHTDKMLATENLKHAVRDLSAVSAGDEPIEMDDDFVDPTPEGEFPTLETFLKVGYQAEDYEPRKAAFYEDKQRAATNDENPGSQVEPTTESTTA